ncbi:MAG TPA: ABC transporter permease [Vicinamibacterales bacterium]|nr:ABC transporter permease [Vicinamibacterales bacterium]
MIRDLRHAVRLLLRSKGWTAVVVVSLALGIGANTAIFTAINGLLLRTIPVDDPETLVRFRYNGDNDMGNNFSSYGYTDQIGGRNTEETFPYPMYLQFRAANQTLVDLFACAPQGQANVVLKGQADLASGFIASGNYFDVLGVHALVGRTFTPDDDRPDAPPVAVISYGYWMRRFGGDRGAIGTVLQIANARVSVIGVTPQEFTGVQQVLTEARDITVPLALDPQFGGAATDTAPARLRQQTTWWLQIMGRRKPGVTLEQVQGNLAGVFEGASRDGWASYIGSLSEKERSTARNQNHTKVPHLIVQSGRQGIYDVSADTYRSITLLGVVVALVLLIVCANVANLLLSRATARQREISVRMSMGATRWRLIRQLLTESVLLAAIGAALGALVAYWGRQLLPDNLATAAALDWRILGFVGGLTIATGILFGIAPALRSSRLNVGAMLKEGGRTMSGGRSRLGKTLVVAQVAISLVLLVGAGLFLRTVSNLRQVDVGFVSDNLLLVPVNPALNRYEQPRILNLFSQMLDELPRVAGVRAVTASQPALLSGSINRTSLYIQGRAKPTDRNSIHRMVVAPNFFDTLGIRVVSGRSLTDRDTQTSAKVVVINDAAAKKFFPRESPIGQHFGQSFETTGDLEIVGVAADTKYNSVRDAPPPTMYVPYAQQRLGSITFELRTAGDPAKTVSAVREAMRRIDPNLPILKISTQTEQIEQRFAQERVFAQAYALFGGLAVLIASVGLFGLMSYSVSRRTNEIGIRMALGAERTHVVGMVMRESLVLVVIGVVVGTGVALGAGRFVASLLFNLAPTDPITMTASAVVMIAVSVLAGYLPARTASRVDPMVALRDE